VSTVPLHTLPSCLFAQVHEWMRSYEKEGATCVLLAANARLLAAFAISDPLKPEAPAVIAALRWAATAVCRGPALPLLLRACIPCADSRRVQCCGSRVWFRGNCQGDWCMPGCLLWLCRSKGLQCHMVTGDGWTTARAIAARVGIPDVSAEVRIAQQDAAHVAVLCICCHVGSCHPAARAWARCQVTVPAARCLCPQPVHAQVLPAGKAEHVRRLQAGGRCVVAMVRLHHAAGCINRCQRC
jgi:hypothetical protein